MGESKREPATPPQQSHARQSCTCAKEVLETAFGSAPSETELEGILSLIERAKTPQ